MFLEIHFLVEKLNKRPYLNTENKNSWKEIIPRFWNLYVYVLHKTW